jgi:hypothetical protein
MERWPVSQRVNSVEDAKVPALVDAGHYPSAVAVEAGNPFACPHRKRGVRADEFRWSWHYFPSYPFSKT